MQMPVATYITDEVLIPQIVNGYALFVKDLGW